MVITEAKIHDFDETIKHTDGRRRLKGYCSLVLDNALIVHDLKIIEGNKGLFVAMPSRKVTYLCEHCRECQNKLDANFCNKCGKALDPILPKDGEKIKYHVDIVHPINQKTRTTMQEAVLSAFKQGGTL